MADITSTNYRDYVDVAAATEALLPGIREVAEMVCNKLASGATVYTFGNGGSASDAQHFTGELLGHYKENRRALAAVTIGADAATATCIANDFSFEEIFSRQVEALARSTDVVAAFTTTGRSPNVVGGLRAAKANGATTLLFGGEVAGPAGEFADFTLLAPSRITPRIQEIHTFLLHEISDIVDTWAAREPS